MVSSIKIALDLEGGDLGSEAVLLAVKNFLKKNKDTKLFLLGESHTIALCKSNIPAKFNNLVEWIESGDSVLMGESPGDAIRQKKDSSMQKGINLVKNGVVNAFVSSGNTGALMVMSKVSLRMIPGIERPAIVSQLPGKLQPFLMLDLGANIECDSNHLFQFAHMGSFLANDLFGVSEPRVRLLNIGEEHTKGNEIIKNASDLLEESNLNYLGYIEANEIFSGKTDVVVCDGFSGNIALKSIEGTADLIKTFLKDGFNHSPLSKLSALFAFSTLRGIKRKLDARKYNGALLIGLNGIVVKSHGGSDHIAFESAIEFALAESKNNIVNKITTLLN